MIEPPLANPRGRLKGRAFLRALPWLVLSALLAACGGGGDSGASSFQPPGGGGGGGGGGGVPGPVTLSGTVTYSKVPFSATLGQGLNFAASAPAPVRGATVEIVGSAGLSVLTSTTTNASGQYSVSVPGNTEVFVRVRAELRRTGTPAWNVTVRDNTAGEALYTLDGQSFNTGAASLTRNLNAPTGFTAGSGYTGARAAAPFAILDAVYEAVQLVLSADPNTSFPELRVQWSSRNIPCSGSSNPSFCDSSAAARARGEIGTTFFAGTSPRQIFVLGDASSDTDEFDSHVIAHEWGHYYQSAFSRDDSLGGEHSGSQRLDLRVAFSEGWGNAFSGMVLRDPLYRDSFVVGGAQQDGGFNVENNAVPGTAGWFSSASVQSIFYDLFDSAADGVDGVNLGFGPIHTVMTNELRTTRAPASIHPLVRALQLRQPSASAAIGQLVSAQQIATGSDDFGSNEVNAGGDARNVPIYPLLNTGVALRVCSDNTAGAYNKLGNRRFARIELANTNTVTVRADIAPGSSVAPSDPDLLLYGAGVLRGTAESLGNGVETLTVPTLPPGSYVLEVYEFSNINPGGGGRGDTCFDLLLTLS